MVHGVRRRFFLLAPTYAKALCFNALEAVDSGLCSLPPWRAARAPRLSAQRFLRPETHEAKGMRIPFRPSYKNVACTVQWLPRAARETRWQQRNLKRRLPQWTQPPKRPRAE